MGREGRLAAAGYLALFACGFSDNARGPLFPRVIDTFHVSDARCSLLVVLGSLAGLPGSMLAGALIARAGPRWAIRVMAALLALGLGIVALAGVLESFDWVPVGASVLGFGLGGLGVCANACVTLATPVERRASALAGLHVTYAVASLLVPLAIAAAVRAAPWALVVAGVALVPALLLPLAAAVPDATIERARGRAPLAKVLPFALIVSCFVVAEVSISVWLVLYAKRHTAYPGEVLLAGFFLGMGAARGLGSVFLRSERVRAAIVGGALASAALVLLGLHVDAAFLAFVGLTVGILFPATISALTHELALEHHGPAIGIVSGAYSAALGAAHFLIGHVSDVRGLGTALHLSPACALAGVAIFVFETRRREP